MQSTQPNKPKAGLKGVKLLIVSLSFAATIAFWNLFSSSANQGVSSKKLDSLPPQGTPVAALNLPPLPTLVPVDIQPADVSALSSTTSQAAVPLRQVNATPTPVATAQVNQPALGRIIISQSKNNSNSGGSAPVTTTRSSR